MPSKDTEKPQDNTGTNQNTKSNRDSSNTNLNRVVPVDIECLRWPEHNNREEIGTRDKGDDKRKKQYAGFLLQSPWEYGILCSICFPETKAN